MPKPLMGTDEATIDEKGRLLVSKKKRERLGENFVVALGPMGCLDVYPEAVWEQKYAEMMSVDSLNFGREQYTRMVLGTADDELKFDAQGRVVIPSKLRELAKLKEKVLIIGCGDRLEIWSESEWDKFQDYPNEYGKDRRAALEQAYSQMKGL